MGEVKEIREEEKRKREDGNKEGRGEGKDGKKERRGREL